MHPLLSWATEMIATDFLGQTCRITGLHLADFAFHVTLFG